MVFEQPFEYESKQFSITVSIGIAYSNDAESIVDFVAFADQALYQAKEENRNKIVTYKANKKPGD